MLSGFETIQIGVKYLLPPSTTLEGGEAQELQGMPASIGTYGRVRVQWESMPGWQEDISRCRSFEELPPACRAYVLRLQELLGGPRIRWIGVGPGRLDVIEMPLPTSTASQQTCTSKKVGK